MLGLAKACSVASIHSLVCAQKDLRSTSASGSQLRAKVAHVKSLERVVISLLILILTCSISQANGRQRHWYRDWKWWVGEAIIAGFSFADAHSTARGLPQCPGCFETNPLLGKHPGTARIVAFSTAGFGVESALHILSWKYCPYEESSKRSLICYALVPGEKTALTIPTIIHNYSLGSKPLPSSSLTSAQQTRPEAFPNISALPPPRNFNTGERDAFLLSSQFSRRGMGPRLLGLSPPKPTFETTRRLGGFPDLR